MNIWQKYKLRLERKRYLARAMRKRMDLSHVKNAAEDIEKKDVLLFTVLRNERVRLPFFLEYYRKLGVSKFIMVDNGSDDGSYDYLRGQDDVVLYHTAESYKRAKYGVDWLNALLRRYACGHWALVVDTDEFFVYPHCDKRPLLALTDWLDAAKIPSFGALLLDTYPKGPIKDAVYSEGQNPLEIAPYFDSGNYSYERKKIYENLYVQGGLRERVMFADRPGYAPALNKIPLIKWEKRFSYVSSTHVLLPRKLNAVYERRGGIKASGALIHTKFLHMLGDKAREELERKQHYAASREYRRYADGELMNKTFWTEFSERYEGWRQLEKLGLISAGDWA